MGADPPSYCLDTSAWLDGWKRYYPIETFPTIWDRVEGLIQAGRLFWAEEVALEILDQDLKTWLTPHASAVIETAVIWSPAQTLQQRFNADLHEKEILAPTHL